MESSSEAVRESRRRARSREAIQRTSIVDTVTVRLRNEILSGAIQPGERIRVSELEERFGVSHIPIREALRRLETEGLVVTSPQRATLASGVALEDLAGLYDLRRLIETPVSRRAAERMTPADVTEIERTLAQLEIAAAHPDSDEFWELHRAFHWAILAPGGSAWIRRVLEQLWQAAERYVRLTVSAFGTIESAMQDHREMAKACEARDAELLATLVERHLSMTEQTIREGYVAMRRESETPTQDRPE